jgi:hypothetical protein
MVFEYRSGSRHQPSKRLGKRSVLGEALSAGRLFVHFCPF